VESFDRFAHTYGKYNVVQKRVIKKYLPHLKKRVVDLGCGSEGLCKYKEFDFYLGIDKSEKMLKLNPCNTVRLDFNQKSCYEYLKMLNFDQIVSFSALQWAEDLKFVFEEIKNLRKNYLLAVFTSSTFKSFHSFLEIASPIYSKEEILFNAKILNPAKIEVLNYEMEFKNPKDMLQYIKFSGVKGDVRARISKLKRFLADFPVKTLEFEIVVLMG